MIYMGVGCSGSRFLVQRENENSWGGSSCNLNFRGWRAGQCRDYTRVMDCLLTWGVDG